MERKPHPGRLAVPGPKPSSPPPERPPLGSIGDEAFRRRTSFRSPAWLFPLGWVPRPDAVETEDATWTGPPLDRSAPPPTGSVNTSGTIADSNETTGVPQVFS